MEESDLLKERFQAITEKHHIQEVIRLKKLELDQEKLKLQHLKKKTLREQWLLHDSVSHNATDFQKQQSPMSDQQQTRALQLKIHSIEMEILSLEQDESMISTNESVILNRLKAVEKSPEEIIKEAHINFVPETLQVTPLSPESLSPSVSDYTVADTPRKTLFAMEINVTKNPVTGESAVLSTATVPPEEFNLHTGKKVYDDGRKCVYALDSQQGSHDLSCISNLSASEVEHLLRSATVHRQVNQHQNPSREGHYFYKHQGDGDRVEDCDVRHHTGQHSNFVLSNNTAEKDLIHRTQAEHCYAQQRNYHTSLSEGHHFGNHRGDRLHHGNQMDGHYSSSLVRTCHSDQEDCISHHTNSFFRSNGRGNGGRPSGCFTPSPHHQDVVTAYTPQLGDEAERYCYSPASQIGNSLNQSTALYHSPTSSNRVHSPLYGDDTPYTILNTLDTTEPITAIFMGFQAAQDDSGQSREFVGSLKAELVVIEDDERNGEDDDAKKKYHALPGVRSYSTGSAAGGKLRCVQGLGDRRTETQTGAGTDEE